MKRRINEIIIHCSGSEFGDADWLNAVHVSPEFGFSKIGYHFVICNGHKRKYIDYDAKLDGAIETGRNLEEEGAHCKDQNEDTIGICLIGVKSFTKAQFIALKVLVKDMLDKFGKLKISGHYECKTGIEQGKTCPNFDMDWFRKDFNDWMLGFRKVEMKYRKVKWK